ncbi:MAG: potassium transporter Kup [Verrucomicrobiota bacterium]
MDERISHRLILAEKKENVQCKDVNSVKPKTNWKLCVGALGVVYGDIGTSPLYTIRECLRFASIGDLQSVVLGSLSLVFWAIVFVVSFKYLTLVTKAHLHGEGGIFALMALGWSDRSRLSAKVILILLGAALLYADGVITPAISVLSAAEGLETLDSSLHTFVVPIACLILLALFWCQRHGTGKIGGIFGPIIFVWFSAIGLLGLWHIFQSPQILKALNPIYGWRLLIHHPAHVSGILGAVVLAITGVEALYADMGHFGRKAIIKTWYFVVLPGLLLNYFGQGAYALSHPTSLANPFFDMAPAGIPRLLLTALSIVATIIASQALISGTFSLTQQGIQLGFFPRLLIRHTSTVREGQIYMPAVNWVLAIGCIALAIGFQSSAKLAAAYGLAVTGTMAVTTIAFYSVMKKVWKWKLAEVILAGLLSVDLILFCSNLGKISEGGWLPLAFAAILLLIMHTWKRGKMVIAHGLYGVSLDPEIVVKDIHQQKVHRVPGCAVFMASNPNNTPIALLHHLKVNRCLQETVILLSVTTESMPRVSGESRYEFVSLGEGFWKVVARHGYMEWPNVPAILGYAKKQGVPCDPEKVIYFFNRETVVLGGKTKMWHWQKALYSFLSRNTRQPREYFDLPAHQIVELGLPVQL